MRIWAFIATLVVTAASAGPAYRWVDENGQVHYSDRPREGAEEIALPQYKRPAPRPVTSSRPAARDAQQAETQPQKPYTVIDITQPESQQTYWNTGGTLDVSINLQPRLQPNHRMVVFLDGERLGVNPGSSNFKLNDIYRGMHTLQVAVHDAFDQQVVRSLPVQFMVQQTSVLNPNRANQPSRPRPNPGGPGGS